MIRINRLAALAGHRNPVYALAPSQKKHIFFTAGGEAAVVEWSLKTMQHLAVLAKVQASIYALHSPATSNVLLIGDRSGRLYSFNFSTRKLASFPQKHQLPVFDILTADDCIYAASEDGAISTWELNTGEPGQLVQVNTAGLRCLALNTVKKHLAAGGKDHVVSILDQQSLKPLHRLEGHSLPVFSLCYSPDGNYLFSGSRDAQLKVWDVANGYSLLKNIPAHLFAINHLSFHPSGKYLASASMDKSIKIWRSADFSLAKIISSEKMPAHQLSVNRLLWMDEGKKLVSVSNDKQVMVWEVELAE